LSTALAQRTSRVSKRDWENIVRKFVQPVVFAAAMAIASCTWASPPAGPDPLHAGAFAVLHTFVGSKSADGAFPNWGVVRGPDGAFYGATIGGGVDDTGTVYRVTAEGSETVLHTFDVDADGANPNRRAILASDGRLYGTTTIGGSGGAGTLYRLNPDGSGFEVVYPFDFGQQDYLASPQRITQGDDGTIFGIAEGGLGNGGIFAVSADGTYRTVHQFAADGSEGYFPISLLVGPDGTLWGTTTDGGKAHGGVAWHIGADGALKIVHSFTSGDGQQPKLFLTSTDGAFYGTASIGGPFGGGTIFRMTPAGKVSVVYGFGSGAFEGYYPAGLVRGRDGSLYGATQSGGKNGGSGTVYRLSPKGRLTILHDFGARFANGLAPWSDGLAVGDDGSLYGVCGEGGMADFPEYPDGMGNVFRVTP
jgi:uncharacterized repeat protein (TIGR03803 family)